MSKPKHWGVCDISTGHLWHSKDSGETVPYSVYVIQTPYTMPDVNESNIDKTIDNAIGCIIGRSTQQYIDRLGQSCEPGTQSAIDSVIWRIKPGDGAIADRNYRYTPSLGWQVVIKVFGDPSKVATAHFYQRLNDLNGNS